MAKATKLIAACSAAATALMAILYQSSHIPILLTLAVTFGTIAYHFCMRLTVGTVVNSLMHNRADYTKRWYQFLPFEERLYHNLHVKKWKTRMPTYDPELFSLRTHTLDEIIQVMCQAEIVHEVIVVLSFLPLLASLIFGAAPVFAVTSLLAALVDGAFVAMQRYNRHRMIQLVTKKERGIR